MLWCCPLFYSQVAREQPAPGVYTGELKIFKSTLQQRSHQFGHLCTNVYMLLERTSKSITESKYPGAHFRGHVVDLKFSYSMEFGTSTLRLELTIVEDVSGDRAQEFFVSSTKNLIY